MTEKETIYPERPSEFARRKEAFDAAEVINLSEKERGRLREWEKPFFEEVKEIKKILTYSHTVYPDAFLSPEGERLFSAFYLDQDLHQSLEEIAEEAGIDLEKIKEERKFSDAFMDDLFEITSDEEAFEAYKQDGVEFKNLSEELGLDDPIVLQGNLPRLFEEGMGEVEKRNTIVNIFYSIDLTKTQKQERKRISNYTQDWARDKFGEEFRESGGKVEDINNPQRIGRVVDMDKAEEKVGAIRDLKAKIKEERRSVADSETNLGEAKKVILDIYQRYINVMLAGEYSIGRLIRQGQENGRKGRRVLDLIKGVSIDRKRDNLDNQNASRTMERIDHFLRGVGLSFDEHGLFVSIPERLAKYAQERAAKTDNQASREYEGVNLKAEAVEKLADFILNSYGLSEGEKSWSTEIKETKKSLSVAYKKKDQYIREVNIPEEYDKNVVDALAVLSHEIEGHVLRQYNREQQDFELRLLEEYSSGRAGVLSEASAMSIESETKKEMIGVGREAKPYYYIALSEKAKGGAFKECYRAFFEKRAEDEYGRTIEEVIEDPEVFEEINKYVFSRILRIFRSHTPLDDDSGYLPRTDQLEYIEQELVVEALKKAGVDDVLYISGVDLFSFRDLIRLGMLDLSKVKKPKMVVARELWPKIKGGLDNGRKLDEIIEELN